MLSFLPHRSRFLALSLLLLLLSLCVLPVRSVHQSSSFPSSWWKFQGDSRNSGEYLAKQKPVGKLKWVFNVERQFQSSPTLGANGLVYIGGADDVVYAVDTATGLVKWEFETGRSAASHGVHSSVLVGRDGTVYVGSSDHSFYCLNGDTGKLKWKFKTGSAIKSSPALGADNTVYFGSMDRFLYALDAETGQLKWKFQTGSYVESSPALDAEGNLYFGSRDGYVYSLDPSGTLRWKFLAGGDLEEAPALSRDGRLYIGSRRENVFVYKVFCINSRTGTQEWSIDTAAYVDSSIAVSSQQMIYFSTSDGVLHSLDGTTGKSLWKQETTDNGGYINPVIGAGNLIYAGASNGKLYALDGKSGKTVWSLKLDGFLNSSIAIGADGVLYVAGKNLYAVK